MASRRWFPQALEKLAATGGGVGDRVRRRRAARNPPPPPPVVTLSSPGQIADLEQAYGADMAPKSAASPSDPSAQSDAESSGSPQSPAPALSAPARSGAAVAATAAGQGPGGRLTRAPAPVLDDSFPAMGTIARVVRDDDGGVDVRSLLADIEGRLSRFDASSDLSRLNADPRPAVPADPLLRAAVAAALRAASLSDGLVDPTLLGVLNRAGYRESRARRRARVTAPGACGCAATPAGSSRPGRPVARG